VNETRELARFAFKLDYDQIPPQAKQAAKGYILDGFPRNVSQAEALGMPDLAAGSVFVPHPIQDATDEEMRMKAQDAIDAIVEALTADG